jgi:hypothetical protein
MLFYSEDSMTPQLVRFALDPTGVSRNNRVQGEIRQLLDRPRRAVVPMYGAFYADTLIIRDVQRQFDLKRDEHYVVMGLYQDATAKFGKEVACIVVITSPRVSSEISLTYQVVGAEYQSVLRMVVAVTANLSGDDRDLVWDAIAGRPSSFYPANHFHDIGDAYAFDPVVNSVETLRQLTLAGDRASQDDLYLNADRRIGIVTTLEGAKGKALMDAHSADPNPHTVYGLATTVKGQRPNIRQPINVTPAANAINVDVNPVLVCGSFNSAYRTALRLVQFQISRTADFATIIDDSGPIKPVDSYTCKTKLLFSTDYYWRYRYNDDDNNDSDWSVPTKFRTKGN